MSDDDDVSVSILQTASHGKIVVNMQPDGNVSLIIRLEAMSDTTTWCSAFFILP
jgi:hypothetical protein